MDQSAKSQSSPKKTAKIVIITDDHGQLGSSFCGNCGADLGRDVSNPCPSCGCRLEKLDVYPKFAGSDF